MSRPHRDVPKSCCLTLVISHSRMQMVKPAQNARRPVRLGRSVRIVSDALSKHTRNGRAVTLKASQERWCGWGGGGVCLQYWISPEVQPCLVGG